MIRQRVVANGAVVSDESSTRECTFGGRKAYVEGEAED